MLNIILLLNCVSLLSLLGVGLLLLKQYKNIKNLITLLKTKQKNEKNIEGGSIPVKLDLVTLNNLIATGIANNSNLKDKNQESQKNKQSVHYFKKGTY